MAEPGEDIEALEELDDDQPAPEKSQMTPMKEDRFGGGVDLAKMKLILDVPLRVTVQLGRTHQLLHDVLSWDTGTIVELDKMAGEAMEIFINDRFIGLGEVVVVNERFGVRLTDITDSTVGEDVGPRDAPTFEKIA